MRRLAAAATVTLALLVPATADAQQAQPVIGGGSFNTAPELKPGTFSDTVAAGETVYWKVRLQKGQILRVKTTVDTSSIETDPSKPDYLEGLTDLDYRLSMLSPLREPLDEVADYRDAATTLEGDTDSGVETGEITGPRVLGYEQVLGDDYAEDKFPGPGEWYVALSVADADYAPAEVPVELPVQLDVTLDGAAQPSSPDVAGALPDPSPTATAPPERDTSTPLAGQTAGPGSPALTIGLVAVLALLGGLGLGALAGRLGRRGAPQR